MQLEWVQCYGGVLPHNFLGAFSTDGSCVESFYIGLIIFGPVFPYDVYLVFFRSWLEPCWWCKPWWPLGGATVAARQCHSGHWVELWWLYTK